MLREGVAVLLLQISQLASRPYTELNKVTTKTRVDTIYSKPNMAELESWKHEILVFLSAVEEQFWKQGPKDTATFILFSSIS
jgi:hypothetical protein